MIKNNITDMIDEIKSNSKSLLNKVGRPAGSGKTPKLVCMLTGMERTTNMNYLNKKAAKLDVKVEDVVELYISKTSLKLLKKKIKENDVLNESVVKSVFTGGEKIPCPGVEKVERALYMNGKGVKNNDPF